MKRKNIISCAVFLLLALSLVLGTAAVLDRKLACHYTRSVRGFFNEEEDSMDILFFGSSHMYCSLSPLELWESTGLRSYLLSTQQQPLAVSYQFMEKALEHQSPKLIVLETSMVKQPLEWATDEVLRDAIDPVPWSEGKADFIKAVVPEKDRASYYFNLAKYHGRWKELSAQSFDFSYLNGRDKYRGYVHFTPSKYSNSYQLSYENMEPAAMLEENVQLLLAMKVLAEEHGARLALLQVPYEGAGEDAAHFKAFGIFAEENDIPMLDLNLIFDEVGFDGSTDYYDPDHFNATGAKKVADCFAQWVAGEFDIRPSPHPDDSIWQQDWQEIYGN